MSFWRIRNSLSLVLILGLSNLAACGDPSPWVSYMPSGHRDLTRKNLDLLTTGSDTYKAFSIGLISDPQVLIGDFKQCKYKINARSDIAFSLVLGDLTDRSLRREFEWVAEIISKFKRPVLTVVGNHDGLLYGEQIYKRMFGELSYSFIYNTIKFVVWNNNPYEWKMPDFGWLESEINSHPKVVIVSHQPPGRIDRYSSANIRMKELYTNPNIIGSFHGHTHKSNYELLHDKPVYTSARVGDTSYAFAHFDADMNIKIESCKGDSCKTLN